jgi:[ribosomal protein S18]-alanine N-acetyltransferase
MSARYPRLTGSFVPQLREIARGSFPRLWEPKEFAYFLDHDCGLCLGDVEEGKVRAYFLGLLVAGDLDVVSIATDPAFRRQGLAEGLLRAALSYPAVERAFLEVECRNTPALTLYKKLGFVVTATRKAYYDGLRDAYNMKWQRSAPVMASDAKELS